MQNLTKLGEKIQRWEIWAKEPRKLGKEGEKYYSDLTRAGTQSSVLMSRTTLPVNLCRVKRSFKPYQNELNSAKDTGEKGKKLCNIDLKIS